MAKKLIEVSPGKWEVESDDQTSDDIKIANINKRQYSDIMDRWQDSDMMQYEVPVFHRDETHNLNGKEVPIFYWRTHVFEGDAGKIILEKLNELGIEYNK